MNFSNEAQARIPHRANPYQPDTSNVRPYEPPEPAVLTLRDLDRLVEARLADARREWASETRREAAEAWERGREYGAGDGYIRATDYAREAIQRVVGGQLTHIQRRLAQRYERPKTTIAAERKWADREAGELHRAITDLEAIGA